jgi:hypothetical protein
VRMLLLVLVLLLMMLWVLQLLGQRSAAES